MRNYYDENETEEKEADEDEFAGYVLTDDTGAEIERENKKKKKNIYEDHEQVEASVIPENEQTVMIDNPKISGLSVGDPLTLVVKGQSAAVYNGTKKAGDLKDAFVAKLLENRKGMHAQCFLYSAAVPVMVKLKFFDRARKNTTRI